MAVTRGSSAPTATRRPSGTGPAAGLAPQADAAPGWIGLERRAPPVTATCTGGRWARTVSSCHTRSTGRRRRRSITRSTDYPLTGKHRDVTCATATSRPAGRHGGRCSSPWRIATACPATPTRIAVASPVPAGDCHVTTGFNVIDRGHFDHDRTRYPLRGAARVGGLRQVSRRPGRERQEPALCHVHGLPHRPARRHGHAGRRRGGLRLLSLASTGFTVAAVHVWRSTPRRSTRSRDVTGRWPACRAT